MAKEAHVKVARKNNEYIVTTRNGGELVVNTLPFLRKILASLSALPVGLAIGLFCGYAYGFHYGYGIGRHEVLDARGCPNTQR